jgi:hypothetical protein
VTKEELATLLNGRQYDHEITKEEEAEAKASGLVVIFGASDDLMELRGAIDEEVGAWEGTTVYLSSEGLIVQECGNSDCPRFQKALKDSKPVEAIWDSEGYSWVYETELPHATFDILEDGEKYCRGIVLELPK